MSDVVDTAIADEEVPEQPEPLDEPKEDIDDEPAEEAGGSGGKPFIVYYNALSRVVMAAFLIAGGTYTIPSVFIRKIFNVDEWLPLHASIMETAQKANNPV